MNFITDNIKLLGLIVTTTPFEYKDNYVSSNFNGYIEITQLESIKNDIEDYLLKTNDLKDEENTSLNDQIYFVNQIIEFLKTKL